MRYFYFILFTSLFSCQTTEYADTILINGIIYTADSSDTQIEALAIKDGLILETGDEASIRLLQNEKTEVIDLNNQFVMPGFIEGHGHFSGLGYSLINLNFLESKNWDEIIQQVAAKTKTVEPGTWIQGRGWHQEKWNQRPQKNISGYPFHDELSAISPDHPVILYHASGHALYANKKAMDLAGVASEMPDPAGGHIVRDQNKEAIGVFEERAMQIISGTHQEYLSKLSAKEQEAEWYKAIALAQEECIKKGITSFQDAGSTFTEVDRYHKMAANGDLNLRLWAMLRHPLDTLKGRMSGFPVYDKHYQFFTCKAIKSEVDGALGAFGAWLLKPYQDKPGFSGQNTTQITDVKGISDIAIENDMQFCVHAIGDRANRIIIDLFEHTFTQHSEKKDWRWRIEHAQHLHPDDIKRFQPLGIIASMQGVHCTSDAPFVVSRLGEERAKNGAYAWRSLIDHGTLIANGTDAPVEDVDPLKSIYASVTRKRTDSGMAFFPEQQMTRTEALRSYTINNAYAAFEDRWKGSIEEGKVADIIVLSNNLLTCEDEEILNTKINKVIINGKVGNH